MTIHFVGNEMRVINTPEEREQIYFSGKPPGDPCGEWLVEVVVQHRMEFIEEHGYAPVTKFFVPRNKQK